MKLAILGTGMIVQELLPVLWEEKIGVFCILGTERSRERTEKLAEKFGIERTFYDYDELLKSEADTIYIALPNNLHYEFGKKALLAGKNVIIEKPITTNIEELRELHSLSKKCGKILLEAMTIHYLPAFLQMKEDLCKIGKIRIVNLNFSQYSSRYDAFRDGKIAPAFDPQQGGGALMDLNVYNIHFMAGLFGAPKKVNYCANIQRDVDTSGILTLDYGDMTAVLIGAKDCQGANLSSIQGEDGRIDFSMPTNRVNSYSLNIRGGETIERSFDTDSHRMIYEFREFEKIIDSGDNERAEKMIAISEISTDVLTQARENII
jgi:predicted dehydrogenase